MNLLRGLGRRNTLSMTSLMKRQVFVMFACMGSVVLVSTGTLAAYANDGLSAQLEDNSVPQEQSLEAASFGDGSADGDSDHVPDALTPVSSGGSGGLSGLLGAVDDNSGALASEGSLETFEETEFIADDESGTRISIGDHGRVALAAEGNRGFEVSFEDVSSSLGQRQDGDPLSYEAGADAVLVPQIIDTHFRGVFVLESPASPTEFTMTVANGDALSVIPADSGGVIFQDSSGEEIGGFAAPWAKDAHNRPVTTEFVVEGQQVRQVVDVTGLAAEDFPVVADPPVYVNYTKKYVIDVRNHGNLAKWQYLNQCTAAKNKKCSIGRTYDVTSTVQTSLNVATSFVGAQIGITSGVSTAIHAKCSITGPGKATLYASANKKSYKIRTVRTYGVAPKLKRETRTSGVLIAYKPNGKYVCA